MDKDLQTLLQNTSVAQKGNYARVGGGRVIDVRSGQVVYPQEATPQQTRELNQLSSSVQGLGQNVADVSRQRNIPLTPQFQQQFSQYADQNGFSSKDSVGPTVTPAGGLPPEYEALYKQLKEYLDALQAKGQVLNPNIDITPEKAAEFLSQAQNEIDPYYTSQLKLAKESFLRGIGYTKDEVLRQEQVAQRNYQTQLRQLGEASAEKGFAQSGIRQRDERELATTTQEGLDTGRRQLGYQSGTLARTFAQQYGGQGIDIPSISETPRVIPGDSQFQTSGASRPLYELSPETYQGLVGSQQFEQRGAVRTRASGLESAFRTNQALSQQRQLLL